MIDNEYKSLYTCMLVAKDFLEDAEDGFEFVIHKTADNFFRFEQLTLPCKLHRPMFILKRHKWGVEIREFK